MDLDIGDSKGRTPLHIALSKGYEDCVCVLLEHSCNVNIQDMNVNTPLWDAIAANHHSILHYCTPSQESPIQTLVVICFV
ncbi:hypothetical protein AAC387_Pa12g0837 [Persea americana]